jgi:hypothetical protein
MGLIPALGAEYFKCLDRFEDRLVELCNYISGIIVE